MGSRVAYDDIPAPRSWLALSFLGVWLYLISQILRGYPAVVSDATGVPAAEVLRTLAFTAGLGSIMVFSGLVAALWRSNLAAGLSPAAVRGLVLGAAGVGVLALFELAVLFGLFDVRDETVASLLRAQPVGDIVGTAMAFAGLASLAVGLTHAAGLFDRASAEAKSTPAPAEKAT